MELFFLAYKKYFGHFGFSNVSEIQVWLCFYTRIVRKPVWLKESLKKPATAGLKILGYYFCLKTGPTETVGLLAETSATSLE